MKLFHIADLHLGKKVNGFSMLEDQRYILEQILKQADDEKPNGVLIAGDVYDKGLPPGDAVGLLDWFLTELADRQIFIALIAGNHDAPERLDFARNLLKKNNIYIAGVVQKEIVKITQTDSFGLVDIYLVPFLKPATAAQFIEKKPDNYEKAMQEMLSKIKLDDTNRNILVAHQFVTNGGVVEQSDSETKSIGGLDEMDYRVFDNFDYAALGHLHSPQKVGRETVRYAGSPLKYSFSEIHQKKSITLIELKEKRNIAIRQIPLIPLRNMREIRGPIEALIQAARETSEETTDYIHAILTDDTEIIDAIGRLRTVYPNIMLLDFDNKKTKCAPLRSQFIENIEKISPITLFEEFFEKQNGKSLIWEQKEIIEKILMEKGEEE